MMTGDHIEQLRWEMLLFLGEKRADRSFGWYRYSVSSTMFVLYCFI